MAELFTPDPAIAAAAQGLSRKAVAFARERCKVSLDGSDDSLEALERVLQMLHEQMPKPAPAENALDFAKMFGSYLGETYRRSHGAAWGVVAQNGVAMPGLKADNGAVFWPWTRVQRRILEGPQQDVAAYYRALADGSPKD